MAILAQPRGRSGGSSLNLAVAALAAIAFAFFTYAMPDDVFSGLIVQSRLPDFLAAATPPLGMKARAAVIAAGALLAFGAVALLLGALDRVPARPRRKPEPEAEAEAPRLRRADAHPDAPSRRPLLAGRDLGGFLEPEADEGPGFPERDDEAEKEMFADLVAEPLPGFLSASQPAAEIVAEEEPVAAPAADLPPAAPEPVQPPPFEALVAQLPEGGEENARDSVSELMRRLESGLSSREQAGEDVFPASPEEEEAAPAPDPEPVQEIAAPVEHQPRSIPSFLQADQPEPEAARSFAQDEEAAFEESGESEDVLEPEAWPSVLAAGQATEEEGEEDEEAEEDEENEGDFPSPGSAREPFAPLRVKPGIAGGRIRQPVIMRSPDENEIEMPLAPPQADENMFRPTRQPLVLHSPEPEEPVPAEPEAAGEPEIDSVEQPPMPQPPAPEDSEPMMPPQVGHRLRSAIDGLNKAAGRG
jgi:hypothetical protein